MKTKRYDLEKTYTTGQVAEIFKCKPESVQRKAREGKLTVVIIGRKLLFPQEAIHEYLQDHLIVAKKPNHHE